MLSPRPLRKDASPAQIRLAQMTLLHVIVPLMMLIRVMTGKTPSSTEGEAIGLKSPSSAPQPLFFNRLLGCGINVIKAKRIIAKKTMCKTIFRIRVEKNVWMTQVVGDKFGGSLEGSQAPPSFWEVPRLPRKLPETSRKFFGDFPGSSLTVELNSNPGVPRKFPRLPRKSPKLPWKFPDFPGGQPLSLGSLTPSPDSQKLSLKLTVTALA